MADLPALRADCANCFGLCCVALTFSVSADFAIDKDAGEPCPNLQTDNRCRIHQKLRPAGFPGCTTYDCFGAGQQLSQVTFGGRDWRRAPENAQQLFAALPIMRQLHELLWYLTEALALPQTRPIQPELAAGLVDTEQLAALDPDALLAVDVAAQRETVAPLLRRTSELVRAEVRGKKKDHRGADLIGAGLRGANLRGADLRGAYLIGADLREADLRQADLIGADLRDTDLRGADLTGALFLTQTQANAAKGDPATRLPPALIRPAHW